ncbi:mucin-22-like [Argopecten irradians]|uniref:mucin-22-like n=1 Tax=Argopecten irradians TaxID=31199 RepID=UPI00371978F1
MGPSRKRPVPSSTDRVSGRRKTARTTPVSNTTTATAVGGTSITSDAGLDLNSSGDAINNITVPSASLDVAALTHSITNNVLAAVMAGLKAQGLSLGSSHTSRQENTPTVVPEQQGNSAGSTGPVHVQPVISTAPSAALGAPSETDTSARAATSTPIAGGSASMNIPNEPLALPLSGTNLSQARTRGTEGTNDCTAGIPASQLLPHFERLLNASLAPSSKSTYKKAWGYLVILHINTNFNLLLSVYHLITWHCLLLICMS